MPGSRNKVWARPRSIISWSRLSQPRSQRTGPRSRSRPACTRFLPESRDYFVQPIGYDKAVVVSDGHETVLHLFP
jgi:hypothetical protein